jgi:hypothetical protein
MGLLLDASRSVAGKIKNASGKKKKGRDGIPAFLIIR